MVAGEEQQMLRCDGGVPADESGELCQHSVLLCRWSSNDSAGLGTECLKAGMERCDA